MDTIPIPNKYEVKKISNSEAEIVIEPFYPGYGTTAGNALRRVLLSSLPGAAVTAVKIKGATHEFAHIPGVKEDVVEIILNIKKIRFKLFSENEVKVILKIKGEKKVTAEDIKLTSDIEIINKSAEIANLTDKNAELEIEFVVNNGRGYIPIENIEKKKFPLGTIAIDAIYTPIINVNYKIENVRVGQMTNYDRLIMHIVTDGSISPDEALKYSSNILVDHFNFISGNKSAEIANLTDKKVEPDIKSQVEEKKVEEIAEEKPKKKRGRPRKNI